MRADLGSVGRYANPLPQTIKVRDDLFVGRKARYACGGGLLLAAIVAAFWFGTAGARHREAVREQRQAAQDRAANLQNLRDIEAMLSGPPAVCLTMKGPSDARCATGSQNPSAQADVATAEGVCTSSLAAEAGCASAEVFAASGRAKIAAGGESRLTCERAIAGAVGLRVSAIERLRPDVLVAMAGSFCG